MVTEKVVDNERALADMRGCSCAAAPYLLVKYRASDTAAHHEVENLPAIKARGQHIHTDRYLWILFVFEFPDHIVSMCDI